MTATLNEISLQCLLIVPIASSEPLCGWHEGAALRRWVCAPALAPGSCVEGEAQHPENNTTL